VVSVDHSQRRGLIPLALALLAHIGDIHVPTFLDSQMSPRVETSLVA
jgi:hypothetical protein